MATSKELPADTAHNTVVGPSILISGKLAGDEDLIVRGRVEGELTLTKTLIIEQTGVVKANVAVRNAIVSGVVVGNINATESVELTREGRMVGDIHAPRVIIVDGASFRGRVDMGDVEPGRLPSAERPALPRPVARPTVRPGAAPARPALPPTATRPSAPAPVSARPTPPPAPPARPVSKPVPPPPPPAAARPAPGGEAARPTAPAAPVPPVLGAGAKKKVVVKKKAR
ncbi:polymer-forming cytoskeletal protein [Myxococcaceae bacterium GXIMD 01537]